MSVTARQQFRTRPIGWIVAAVAVLAGLIGLGIWAYVATRPEAATVMRRDVIATVSLAGRAVAPPSARADVMAPYRAPVAKVYTSVGDVARRGALLVELSLPSAQSAYEQARQAAKAAETAYARAQARSRGPVEAAKKRLAVARAAEKAARQRVAGTAPALERATGATPPASEGSAGATPPESESSTGTTPQQPAGGVTVREPTADLQQAAAARVAAEQALRQAQTEMEAAVAPYRQQLEAARTQLQEARSGRNVALIRAPIRGTVLALNVRPGAQVGEDTKTPVATIVDLSALQVQAEMKPDQASAVKRGMPVTLTFQELPGQPFDGTVRSITTAVAGPLRGDRYVALIDVKNDHGAVKPDMHASAAIKTGEARSVLAVPSDAVDRDRSGRPVVKVLRAGAWHPVVVEVGLSDGHYTEIKSGLREGDTVQVTPSLV